MQEKKTAQIIIMPNIATLVSDDFQSVFEDVSNQYPNLSKEKALALANALGVLGMRNLTVRFGPIPKAFDSAG